ncbi:MAG: DUF975 family protein, partial [Acutalibacteraceae bacterium]|nr:DUF975 family protein [Acutalibacteraceae bacterium]
MKTRAELKEMAKQQIKGNIGMLFVIALIIGAISGVAGAIPPLAFAVSIIVTPAFSISIIRVYQELARGGKKPEAKDAFAGFDDFWSAFKALFLVGLFTFLWSLLFIIPGII